MGALELSSFSRNYQFPSSALSPLALPQVTTAMREAHSRAFGEYSHLVDRKSHAAFCLDAHEGGLIGDKELDWLNAYPNDYGLHLVTNEVIGAIESRIGFSKVGLIPGVKRRTKLIGTPAYELQPAAQTTLACIEAGLFTAESVEDLVALGPNCAYHLMQKVEQSLVDLATADCPDVKDWLNLGVNGANFYISARFFNRYELTLPSEDCEEFREVAVFLFKALDAMTTYLVHFHTPSSFMGVYSYDNHGLADAYGAIKERIQNSSLDELISYLMETPEDKFPFESWMMGIEGDDRDQECIEKVAHQLKEMDGLTRRTHFTLTHSENSNHPMEIQELIDQVQDSINAGSKFKPVLEVIKDAFALCLTYAQADSRAISEHELESSAEEGVGLFETLVVTIRGEYEDLEEEACNGFDERVSGIGGLELTLPLDAKLLAQQTIPIIRKTKQCVTLLSRLTQAL